MSEETRRCSRCGQEKKRSDFYPYRRRSDGAQLRRSICKECDLYTHREWVNKNPDRAKALLHKSHSAPAYRARQAAKHSEKYHNMNAVAKAELLSKQLRRGKAWHAGLTVEKKARWIDQLIRSGIRKRFPDAYVEPVDRLELIRRDRSTCYLWCRRPLTASEVELDHVIPLARGGPHMEWNLRVACRKCNARKGNRLLGEIPDLIFRPLVGRNRKAGGPKSEA